MEEIASSESEEDSDEYSKKVEEELYSVLHYNDFSQGVPPELLEKYSIAKGNNEFIISFKANSSTGIDKTAEVDEHRPNNLEKLCAKQEKASSPADCPSSSEDDDVIIVETDSEGFIPRGTTKTKFETVQLECSDTDSDSSVEILDMSSNKRKHSDDSVIELSDDDDDELRLSINTTGGEYDSDGNVSDVVGKTSFEWSEVSSPSTWTQEMRKYYNSACKRLRYFDHKKIRQQIPKGNNTWFISKKDLYPDRGYRPRCLICRQMDHLAHNCPKQEPTCHMCGSQGHNNYQCPNSICLQCGKKNDQFTSTCRSCAYMMNRECFNCKQTGHESRFCPEKWREFHSTVDGPVKRQTQKNRGPTQCCNCGDTNHIYEECKQQYLSNCTRSLPAYSWLFGRGSFEDWRYGGSSPAASGPPHKRPRVSGFDDELSHFNNNRSIGLPWLMGKTAPWKARRKKKKKVYGRSENGHVLNTCNNLS